MSLKQERGEWMAEMGYGCVLVSQCVAYSRVMKVDVGE